MTLKDIEQRLEEIGIHDFNEPFSEISNNPKHLKVIIDLNYQDLIDDYSYKFWDFLTENSCRSKDTLMVGVPKDLKLIIEYENSEESHNVCKITYYKKEPIIGTIFFVFLNKAIKEFLNKIYDEI